MEFTPKSTLIFTSLLMLFCVIWWLNFKFENTKAKLRKKFNLPDEDE